ncbi:MAG: hemolysin family protein [Chloroherpetonaceae bacterium]|nr:hemolysin family protein [Chloroherpetonaceae bacterium]
MSIGLEIVLILLLILANGIFALSEMAVVSARKTKLLQMADEGDEQARTALELANAPEHFLSTVQVGITLIGVFAGAYSGATIAEQLAAHWKDVPYIGQYSQPISLGIVVLIVTYLSLVIGELVPKRLALVNPELVAKLVASPMKAISALFYPAIHVLSSSTNTVLRFFGVKPKIENPITEEEIKVLIEQGTQAGTFDEVEQDMVERVFRLGDKRVSAIMTPRTDIIWLSIHDSPEEIRRQIVDSPHSFFPVCGEDLDEVLGVVHVKDLLARNLCGEPFDLRQSMKKPLFIAETTPPLKVLELFKSSRIHIGIVIDEYGTTQGLVTLNDILEAIVGDIPTVNQPEKQKVVQREDGSWLIDGMMSIDEFSEVFEHFPLPDKEERDYETLGGFILHQLGSVPAVGQHFDWKDWRFEVVDLDGNRVDKILLTH